MQIEMRDKSIRRGDIYYNCIIPEEETWEETLARENLKIVQIHEDNNREWSVGLSISKDGKLVTNKGKGTEKEILTLLTGVSE